MIPLAAKLSAVLLIVQIALVFGQPIPRTQWEIISDARIALDPPRAATFSDGSYIVVYVVIGPNSNSAVGTIFDADGTVLVPEFLLPDSPATSNAAPRVLIFSDDMFLTAWRDTQSNEIRAKMWYQNGTALGNQFRISLNSIPPKTSSDSFEIAVMPDDEWVFAYAGSTAWVCVQYFDTKQSVTSSFNNFNSIPDTHLTLTVSFSENQIYLFFEGGVNLLHMYRIAINLTEGYTPSMPSFSGVTPQRPFATVMSSGNVPVFWHSEFEIYDSFFPNSIGVTVITPGFGFWDNYTFINNNDESDGAVNANAVDLGNDRLLVAYEGTLGNVTRPIYRTVLVSTSTGEIRALPLGPEAFDDSVIVSPFLLPWVQSEIVVVAINTTGSRSIVRRVLTFCGNSAVELREQCDGTEFCTTNCLCEQGFVSQNGRCVPNCGDGLIVGSEQCDSSSDSSCDNANCVCASGYIPVTPRQNNCVLQPATFRPSVGPTLDCIARGQVPVAHFSFLNEDGFLQTIPHGDLNQFIPDTLGANRPTQFAAGASLTYPAAPFRLELSANLQSFTWLLGQFNLTVDLSNISALYCPRDVSVVVQLLTSDVLNDDLVQVLLNNFARRFGISASRLTATVVLNNPGPAERRRGVQQNPTLYDYTVTITIAPPATVDEPSAEDVLDDFFTEYKNTTRQEEINNELTEGLESINPQVKEITPAPTGVSVRSERFETPPQAENPPQAVTQPVKVASASLNMACLSLAFLFVVFLAL